MEQTTAWDHRRNQPRSARNRPKGVRCPFSFSCFTGFNHQIHPSNHETATSHYLIRHFEPDELALSLIRVLHRTRQLIICKRIDQVSTASSLTGFWTNAPFSNRKTPEIALRGLKTNKTNRYYLLIISDGGRPSVPRHQDQPMRKWPALEQQSTPGLRTQCRLKHYNSMRYQSRLEQ